MDKERTPEEHKWPSVICAALMNGSTSSAKSKTRGHGRHHRWFVNRQGVWASRQQGHTVEAAGGMEGGTDQCGGFVSREPPNTGAASHHSSATRLSQFEGIQRADPSCANSFQDEQPSGEEEEEGEEKMMREKRKRSRKTNKEEKEVDDNDNDYDDNDQNEDEEDDEEDEKEKEEDHGRQRQGDYEEDDEEDREDNKDGEDEK
ncbi:unnamed protein product [Pleuronectes platessa]|uniref:Uncharacterized protein n=1 Tax=Pleuronectes platessa TaxID=8262 RepID=A0A9N7YMK5_PLEPL|nr:unnamed protein product [Pleuronectes platessa]